MKKYISAILIPCLLLQFCCCSSSRPIALSELENVKEAEIVTKDSTVYKLSVWLDKKEVISNPDIFFSYKWKVNVDSSNIKLNAYKANKDSSDKWVMKEEAKNINFKEILSVSDLSEDSNVNAIIGISVIAGILFVVFTILLINWDGPQFGSY